MSKALRVLVTGGAGYIGSHCCKALAHAGHEPIVYDNLFRGHADAVKWGALIEGDMRDQDLLEQTLATERIDAVIHFAALAYVGESVQNPEWYYDNNVGGMLSLLNAVKAVGVQQIVFSSSCATYGIPPSVPIHEDTPQNPINPYGRTKLICEWMLGDAARSGALRFAALRYFNAAGADPEGVLSERHDPETHLLPLALMAALGTGKPLGILGTDYPTPDGTCVRDYIHVDDLARAHVMALGHLSAGGASVKLNLGTGRGTSVREVTQAVERVTGKSVPLFEAPRRAGDPPALVADAAKAREVLGFETRWNDIDDMVRHAAPTFGPASTKAATS